MLMQFSLGAKQNNKKESAQAHEMTRINAFCFGINIKGPMQCSARFFLGGFLVVSPISAQKASKASKIKSSAQ
jgi:hypothetical protein